MEKSRISILTETGAVTLTLDVANISDRQCRSNIRD